MNTTFSGNNFNIGMTQKVLDNSKNNAYLLGNIAGTSDSQASGAAGTFALGGTSDLTTGVSDAGAAAVAERGTNTDRNGANANTYEGLLKETDNVKSEIMANASNAKLGLKALLTKLDGSTAVKLDEDGFNLTDATEEDMVNIVDKIRIELAMHCDSYVDYGTQMSRETIEAGTGSVAMANRVMESQSAAGNVMESLSATEQDMMNRVESRLSGAGLPTDDNTVTEVKNALDKAGNLEPLSENAKNYMVDNSIGTTIEGLSEAQNSGNTSFAMMSYGNSQAKISDVEFSNIRGQVESVIEAAGMDVNNITLATARAFIDNQIPLTTDNLKARTAIDGLDLTDMSGNDKQSRVLDKIIDNMIIGNSAESTDISDKPSVIEEVRDAIETLNSSGIADVANVLKSGETFTIASLKMSISAGNTSIDVAYTSIFGSSTSTVNSNMGRESSGEIQIDDSTVMNSYRIMCEARIMLTAQAGVVLSRNNVSLMTTPISELNEKLQAMEMSGLQNVYEMSEDAFTSVYEESMDVRIAIDDIKRAPLQMYSQVMEVLRNNSNADTFITIADMASSGSSLRQQYERAGQTYEAVGTEVRKDLGDSLTSAVQNSTDSIIDELGLEGTTADRLAVKVLAANSMDMTRENVEKIKEVNEVVSNLIENMKPETVLNMINAGINPMNADIRDLNSYLTDMNQNASKDNEEKYSKFLYKLDRTGGIDESSRKKFIGIYQMMNIFTKDAGNAVGALVKQGSDITMNNLMAAYTSRKHAGMDETIDDSTGLAEITGTVSYYTALFMQSDNLVTPNTLKNVDNTYGIGDQSVDKFVDQLAEQYDDEVEKKQELEYVKAQADAAEVNATVLREIRRADIASTTGNIQAVKTYMESGNITGITTLINRMNREDDDSFSMNSTIEKIGHKEELEAMYRDMKDTSEQELEEAVSLGGDLDTELDVNYEGLLDLRMMDREIGYIENLSMRHDYRIPYTTEEGNIGMINLSLISDSENAGKISIKMNSNTFGNVSVEARIDNERAGIFIVTEGNMNSEAEEKCEALKGNMSEKFNFSEVNIYRSTSKDTPYSTYESDSEAVPTDTLYEIAGEIVKALA